VAFDSGFDSRSIFYFAFERFTVIKPSYAAVSCLAEKVRLLELKNLGQKKEIRFLILNPAVLNSSILTYFFLVQDLSII